MVNNRSSANIFFYDAFVYMSVPMNHLKPIFATLINFMEDSIEAKGEIMLLVTVGIPPK